MTRSEITSDEVEIVDGDFEIQLMHEEGDPLQEHVSDNNKNDHVDYPEPGENETTSDAVNGNEENERQVAESDKNSDNLKNVMPKVERTFSQSRKRIWQECKPLLVKNLKTTGDHHYQKTTPEPEIVSVRGDMYEHFGKYVASVLRDLGPPSSWTLQQEITALMMTKLRVLQH